MTIILMLVIFAVLLMLGAPILAAMGLEAAVAIGSVMIPMMTKAGYRKEWAASIAAAAGTGILIPPSITMIVLGTISNLSIKQLFLASLLPAVALAIAKALIIYYGAKTAIEPSNERITFSSAEAAKSFVAALPALFAPVIIFV